jgi:hypothetical protein
MKKLIPLFVSVIASGLIGCGSPVDNVAACEDFVKKVKCGSIDITNQVDCSTYGATTCDISEYFNCLSTKYVCSNGMYDTTKLASAGECAAKAVCR